MLHNTHNQQNQSRTHYQQSHDSMMQINQSIQDSDLTNRDHAHDIASPERIRALQIEISRRQFQPHLMADPSKNRQLSQVWELVAQFPLESLA